MSQSVYRINRVLSRVVSRIGIGSNVDLFYLFWTVLSGRLLSSRGALFPALADFGLPDDAVRRSHAAFATGVWTIEDLIQGLDTVLAPEGEFHTHTFGGFHPVAGDLTAFYRPHLKGCATKHYCSEAGKALPAIRMGILGRVGSVGSQRFAAPLAFVRSDPNDPRETAHRLCLLDAAKSRLASDELLVLDRGFPLSEVIEGKIERFLVRLPRNFTARRSTPPPYPGWGRPATKGEIVRPLPREYKGHEIAATPPDRTETWTLTGENFTYDLRADVWEDLVLKESAEANPVRFRVLAVSDPRFAHPLLLATRQAVSGADSRSLYLDRWPIEGLPLAAKVLLGAGRQFVFGTETRHRLPELALLSGALVSYLAATEPAHAAGFWDQNPKPTGGRLRRFLASVHSGNLGELPQELRRKHSPTDHLLKGVSAHRRQKSPISKASESPPAP